MPFVAMRVFGHEPVEITADWGLRDLKPGMAYTLCNSLECRECGLLFLDYRFTDLQMAALYRGYRDAEYTRQRDRYEPGYASRAALDYGGRHAYLAAVEAWLAPWLPDNPAVLDVGGGSGVNSLLLGRSKLLHVHDISGTETVAGAEQVDASAIARTKYDLVTCCQVLEHLAYPLDLIEQMLPAVGAETLVYLEVPVEALVRDRAPYPARLKRYWHEHVNFFTEDSIRRLCQRAGLEIIRHHVMPVDLGTRPCEIMGFLARRVP